MPMPLAVNNSKGRCPVRQHYNCHLTGCQVALLLREYLFQSFTRERIGMAQSGLGVALRTLRERRTLSLREVSQLSDVDHAYVHRLETGEKTSPSEELVGKLLKVLKPTEREASIVRWLVDHQEADPELVTFALDDDTITIDEYTAAAGSMHRGTKRPDMATLIARVRRILAEE